MDDGDMQIYNSAEVQALKEQARRVYLKSVAAAVILTLIGVILIHA